MFQNRQVPPSRSHKNGLLWISWEYHRRSVETSARLGAHLAIIEHNKKSQTLRYILSSWATIVLLLKHRPLFLVVQSPSIVLATLAAFVKPFFSYKLCIDAHNAGIKPSNKPKRVIEAFARFSIRRAEVTVITNKYLENEVKKLGGCPFILPDPIPVFRGTEITPLTSAPAQLPNVVFICSWSDDEPMLEILQAADILSSYCAVMVTGRPKQKHLLREIKTARVQLPGFLPESDYIGALNHADVIVVLTTRPDCLVCGGYEAMALGKPLVTSNTPALRDFYGNAAEFTSPRTSDIVKSIDRVLHNNGTFKARIEKQARRHEAKWADELAYLKEKLGT